VASLVIIVLAVLVLLCGQTDTHTDNTKYLTPATVVGVSNGDNINITLRYMVV